MDYKTFTDESCSTYMTIFESLTNNGMDVKTAHDSARDVLMQVLMAYGSLEVKED